MRVKFARYTALLLVFVFAIGVLPVLADGETMQRRKLLYNQNFDSYVTGASPTAFNLTPNQNEIKVVEVPGAEDKSACMSIKSESICRMGRSFPVTYSGKIVMEMSLRIDNHEGSQKILPLASGTGGIGCNFLTVNESGAMTANGMPVGEIVEGKFYDIIIAIDFDSGCYDVYLNGRCRALGVSLGAMKDINFLRFDLLNIQKGCSTKLYINNFMLYQGEPAVSASDRNNYLRNASIGDHVTITDQIVSAKTADSVALFVGSNNALIDNNKVHIDEQNLQIVPVIKNDRTFVPVRFVAEALGGKVLYNDENKSVSLRFKDKTVEFTVDSVIFNVNGKEVISDTAPYVDGGRTFLPLRFMGELCDKQVYWDRTGLIILSDHSINMDWTNDARVMRKVIGNIIYDRPDGSVIIEKLKDNNPDNAHPRVLATAENFENIKLSLSSGDEIMIRWMDTVSEEAERQYALSPVVYEKRDGRRILDNASESLKIIGYCAFMHQITGEERWSQRAIKEALNVASWQDFNSSHFLDTGTCMYALGLAYDWLYDELTEEQREIICDAIVEKGFAKSMDHYLGRQPSTDAVWAVQTHPNNWSAVCNGGTIVAALAIGDVREEESAEVLDYAIENIEGCVNMWAPDGAWYEGPSYWQLTITYLTNVFSTLESALGDDYGFMLAPGVKDAIYYMQHVTGPEGHFNYSDSDQSYQNPPEVFYFATYLKDESLSSLRLKNMNELNQKASYRDMLWYTPVSGNIDIELDLDSYYAETELVTMRSGWDSATSIFAGLHCGRNDIPHSQLDTGTFVLDSNGTRFAMDLGRENYNLGGDEYDLYKKRAEGHNTIVFNPDDEYDQEYRGSAPVIAYDSNESSVYAVADMSSTYATDAEKVLRGVKLCDRRRVFIVQDEVATRNPSEMWWFMHTKQDIEISEDGKTAVLSEGDNCMLVKILAAREDAVFQVLDAKPFESSPYIAGQNPNRGIRKLAIRLDNVEEETVSIGFAGFYKGDEVPDDFPQVVPLNEWELDKKSEETNEEPPVLTDLKIDGKTIEHFNAKTNSYTFSEAPGERYIPEVIAEGDGEIKVVYPDYLPGVIRIILNRDGVKNTYIIRVNTLPLIGDVTAYTPLSVNEVTAFDIPQPENGPENTLDNNPDTRWSCDGETWISYDLGEIKELAMVGVGFYKGNQRTTTFEIMVSENGKDWQVIHNGDSTGQTNDVENYNFVGTKARYIRLNCYGTSEGTWNSITEFDVYGTEK